MDELGVDVDEVFRRWVMGGKKNWATGEEKFRGEIIVGGKISRAVRGVHVTHNFTLPSFSCFSSFCWARTSET